MARQPGFPGPRPSTRSTDQPTCADLRRARTAVVRGPGGIVNDDRLMSRLRSRGPPARDLAHQARPGSSRVVRHALSRMRIVRPAATPEGLPPRPDPPAATKLLCLGVGLASGSALAYEIVLTRLFAIAQGYHFAFLAVSLALLGFGASGTALALLSRSTRPLSPRSLPLLSALLALSFPLSYLVANYLPVDPYRLAWNVGQSFWLAGYLLALVVPFFLAGSVQGLALSLWSGSAAQVYAANLAGSALGCGVALVVLSKITAERSLLLIALLGTGATLTFLLARPLLCPLRTWRGGLTVAIAGGLVIAAGLALWQAPAWFDLRLSPYKTLAQILRHPDAQVVGRRSSAFARIDVIKSTSLRSAPGLSLSFQGAFPEQTGLVVDGDNLYALTPRGQVSQQLLEALPIALPFALRPESQVLIIQPGGGLDVWAALAGRARSITVVDKNPALAEAIRGQAGNPYKEPAVRVVTGEPRGFLARDSTRYDLIDLALSANFRSVTAGAFTLSEDYTYTLEAFRAYLGRLTPEGILVVQRWLQLPPTEELRAGALLVEALRQTGVSRPDQHLVALRSFNTMLLLAKAEPWTTQEIAQIRKFATSRQFDLVHLPGLKPEETNRFQRLQSDVYYESFRRLLDSPAQLFADYDYEVRPPRDDRPFFFHFFKWRQLPTVIALLGKTWQPFGGTGYLLLLGLLGAVAVMALVLILLPVLVLSRRDRLTTAASQGEGPSPAARLSRWRLVAYFSALGLGFMLVEIPLIQRFVLLLDFPVYAFTVVLFGLLVFSGIGSLLAERVSWRAALLLLSALIVAYAFLLDRAVTWLLPYPLALRVGVAPVLLAPLGLLLGIPFPRGIALLHHRAHAYIPLAWGVNGFTSTLSAILATLIALSFGFRWVLLAGALAYLGASSLVRFAQPISVEGLTPRPAPAARK